MFLLFVLTMAIWFIGAIIQDRPQYPNNGYFSVFDTRNLFKALSSVDDSVIVERYSTKESGPPYGVSSTTSPYVRMYVDKVGADTIYSVIFPIYSANAILAGECDSLSGDSVHCDLFFGLYRGQAYGDNLGMEWYHLEEFEKGEADTFKINLYDSTWFKNEASPWGMIMIAEKGNQKISWSLDFINVKE